jgi:DNA mismatch repair protein MutS
VAQTPLLKQYLAIKEKHKDDVLLYRMGDFYELFFDDAELVSKALGIAITARGTGADAYAFAGFPVHAVDRYLPRLIAQGFRVAICEQTEDPALARGKRIVERAVVEVITPGTLTDEKLLEARAANFLLAVCLPRARSRTVGLAWFEASSGRFLVAEVERERVDAELARIAPAELLVSESLAKLGERRATRARVASPRRTRSSTRRCAAARRCRSWTTGCGARRGRWTSSSRSSAWPRWAGSASTTGRPTCRRPTRRCGTSGRRSPGSSRSSSASGAGSSCGAPTSTWPSTRPRPAASSS